MDKLRVPESCEECIKNNLNKIVAERKGVKHCPFEFLNYIRRTVDFFKKEFDFDVTQLQQLIPVVEEKTMQCLRSVGEEVERENAELERVERMREQLGLTDFMRSMEGLREQIEIMSEAVQKLAKANEVILKQRVVADLHGSVDNEVDDEISVDNTEDKPARWRTVALNIKKRNVESKIQQILDTYPNMTRDDIKVFKNKRGKYTIMFNKAKT